jgi:hypothetical protein
VSAHLKLKFVVTISVEKRGVLATFNIFGEPFHPLPACVAGM